MPHLTSSPEGFPSALRDRCRWVRLGSAGTPALVCAPAPDARPRNNSAALVLWMHGRTVTKELDPGRYLRWIRNGIAACAVDLPGHGERFDPRLQHAEATLEVVSRMVEEVDGIVSALRERAAELGILAGDGDRGLLRVALGGMSAGGMAALVRLCRPHGFMAATVEATIGSLRWQAHRAMWDEARARELDPIAHLEGWRDIPFQAIHAAHDEWIKVDGQREFVDALRARSSAPSRIEFLVFEERTGAPAEHAGFGRFGSQAKDAQLDFLRRAFEL